MVAGSPKIPPMQMDGRDETPPRSARVSTADSPRSLGKASGHEKYTDDKGRFAFLAFAQNAGLAALQGSMSLAAVAAEEAACESVREPRALRHPERLRHSSQQR